MKNPKVVAIDFDETIGLYNPEDNGKGYEVQKVYNVPNPKIVELIKNLRSEGHKVIVYSSRWWGDFNALTSWFKNNNIEVDDIILGRFKADVYICDKSINPWDNTDIQEKVNNMLDQHHSWGMHMEKIK